MGQFPMERLSDAPLPVSQVTCECKVWRCRRKHRSGGLMTFRGVYPPGAAGKDDARYIRWLVKEFYTLYSPDGMVFDCRELDYVWGDDLDFPDREPYRTDRFPVLVVLRPEQQAAYAFPVPMANQRLDLQTALAEVDEAIRSMKSRL